MRFINTRLASACIHGDGWHTDTTTRSHLHKHTRADRILYFNKIVITLMSDAHTAIALSQLYIPYATTAANIMSHMTNKIKQGQTPILNDMALWPSGDWLARYLIIDRAEVNGILRIQRCRWMMACVCVRVCGLCDWDKLLSYISCINRIKSKEISVRQDDVKRLRHSANHVRNL